MKNSIFKFSFILFLIFSGSLYAQEEPESSTSSKEEIAKALRKGIVIPIDKTGKSWMKLLVLAQLNATYTNEPGNNATEPASNTGITGGRDREVQMSVERARFITAANLFDRVFFLSQFGITGINNDNINTLGQDPSTQLSLLTLYTELNLHKAFNVGFGLHNYRGVSRIANAGLVDLTRVNFDRSMVPTLALTDQFSYPLGMFVKGKVGKVRYQFAVDEASRNNFARDLYQNIEAQLQPTPLTAIERDEINPLAPNTNAAVYRGAELLGGAKAGTTYSGYVEYHLMDEEDDRTAFRTGSYFGTKSVLNIGGGFNYHPNGSVILDGAGNLKGEDVKIFGADVYYDAPINSKKDAVSFYGLYQNMDYGKDLNFSQYSAVTSGTPTQSFVSSGLTTSLNSSTLAVQPFATGSLFYSQAAFFHRKSKLQPYGFYQHRNIDATGDDEIIFGGGLNYLLAGPNVRLTAEYNNRKLADNDSTDLFTLQLFFFM